jgi:hypothetical protein
MTGMAGELVRWWRQWRRFAGAPSVALALTSLMLRRIDRAADYLELAGETTGDSIIREGPQ